MNNTGFNAEIFGRNFMSIRTTSIISMTILGCLIAASCHAQYVWVDEKGSKQFSDLPPPASTPKNRILKSPTKAIQEPTKETNQENPNGAALPNEKLQKPVTTAGKNEDYMKRKLEQEEKDKKAATEKQASMDKANNCERARSYQQSLESGIRIANNDKNGERSFMSDEQRSRELNDVKRSLSECK
jgi:hypothetical protein